MRCFEYICLTNKGDLLRINTEDLSRMTISVLDFRMAKSISLNSSLSLRLNSDQVIIILGRFLFCYKFKTNKIALCKMFNSIVLDVKKLNQKLIILTKKNIYSFSFNENMKLE